MSDKFYLISEVAKDVGVAQHVLRFWESQFIQIKPMKRNGRRIYRESDVNLIKKVQDLLHNQCYTIKGVKRYLLEKENINKEDKSTLNHDVASINKFLIKIDKIRNKIENVLSC